MKASTRRAIAELRQMLDGPNDFDIEAEVLDYEERAVEVLCRGLPANDDGRVAALEDIAQRRAALHERRTAAGKTKRTGA